MRKFIRKSLIFIFILFLSSMGYYWWIGTPQYSMTQLVQAIEAKDLELALKYIDVDSITDKITEISIIRTLNENFSQSEQSEEIGMESFYELFYGKEFTQDLRSSLELGTLERYLPFLKAEIKERVVKEIKGIIYEGNVGFLEACDKVKQISSHSAYIKCPGNVRFILAKTPERYWKITDVKGIIEAE